MNSQKVGMTKEEVVEVIGQSRWPEFLDWMSGQTGAMASDGTLLYYQWDVERFKRGLPVND